jgi:hypothetical protein
MKRIGACVLSLLLVFGSVAVMEGHVPGGGV